MMIKYDVIKMPELPWSCWQEKCCSSLHHHRALQICQIKIRFTTACDAYCKRGIKHAPQTSMTSNIASVGHDGSHCPCCSSCAPVVVFQLDVCRSGWRSFQTLLLILTLWLCDNCGLLSLCWLVELNSCRLIFWSDFLAVVSNDVVHFSIWQSFNSQNKVVTMFRCSGHFLYWFSTTLATFLAKITTIHLCLSKLCL